ncbi:MAG: PAS domain S-box protein, partial [Draconibacterium sp.]|nr:PAS domain S-box protein [Draconibacterium sp.]
MRKTQEIFEIEKVKNNIIFSALLIGTVLGFVSFVFSLLAWDRAENRIHFLIDFSVLAFFLISLIFYKKLSIKAKTVIILVGILLFVFVDLFRHGVFSDNKILLILIPIFAFLGFNQRKTILILVISALLYFVFAVLYLEGIVLPVTDYDVRADHYDVWVINILLISIVAAIIVIVLKKFIDNYNNLVEELRNQNTDLNKAKLKAEENEVQFRKLFENAADAIFIADEESGKIIDVNSAAERLMQMPKGEIIGLHQKELHPQSKEKYAVNTFLQHKQETGKSATSEIIENTVVRKDGTEVPIEILAFKTTYKGKVCIVGTFRDITAHKKAQMELLKAKEAADEISANVTAIIEGTNESIWAFNRNYEILYINHTFQNEFLQSFGVKLEPGINLLESLPKPIQPAWKTRYDRVLANEQFSIEDALDLGDKVIYIQIGFNPIVKDGQVIG